MTEEVRIRINREGLDRVAKHLSELRENTAPIVEVFRRLSEQLEKVRATGFYGGDLPRPLLGYKGPEYVIPLSQLKEKSE